jgi:hypothetical protein
LRLDHLMQQYRERCRFYAEEVARQLSMPAARSRLVALGLIAQAPVIFTDSDIVPQLGSMISSASARSRHTHASNIIRDFFHLGLLRRVARTSHVPSYMLSDFGQMVVEALPQLPTLTGNAGWSVRTVTLAKRKHDWEALMPVVEENLAKGLSIKKTALVVGVPYPTLQRRLYRHGSNGTHALLDKEGVFASQ